MEGVVQCTNVFVAYVHIYRVDQVSKLSVMVAASTRKIRREIRRVYTLLIVFLVLVCAAVYVIAVQCGPMLMQLTDFHNLVFDPKRSRPSPLLKGYYTLVEKAEEFSKVFVCVFALKAWE